MARINASSNDDDCAPIAYGVGLVTIILMALICLWLSMIVMNMGEAAWGFSGFYSFGAAFIGGPFWLASGIWCLASRKKSKSIYRSELSIVGWSNIIGIMVTAFLPIFYKGAILVWLICCGLVFGLLILASQQRKNNTSKAKRSKKSK